MKQFKLLKIIELLLISLVDILIEKETISGEEFRNIVAEYTPLPEKVDYKSQLLTRIKIESI